MKKFSLNSIELQEYQPNRYPFLMIDYVDEVLPGKYARGYKNMTMNGFSLFIFLVAQICQGHYNLKHWLKC